jgi:hypothetical protein
MASALLWDARPTGEAVIASTGVLKNLANDGVAVAPADVGNGTDLKTHADFLLYVHDFASAPSAGGYFALYIIYEFNTTYGDVEDGDVANVTAAHLNASQFVGLFPVNASDEDQYIQLIGIPIGPHDFRCVVVNKSGQAIANSDGSTLTIFRYSYESQ